ncbi:HU family DNA-binding protein [Fusobacterium sp.]|uniref:HU family DNA-binding protein n=1 Tax=Fusobacterium sp. TaxID=68766 RepID=UPI003966D2BD
MKIINKRSFAKIYQEIGKNYIDINQALKEIEIFLETMKEALIKHKKIKFVRRGTFEILDRKPRMISNPVTRELMKIYPQKK